MTVKVRRTRIEQREYNVKSLLDAGLELLKERPVRDSLDTIRATEVAYRAGLSTGAFYYHWEDQQDFRSDLVAKVFEERGDLGLSVAIARVQELAKAGPPPDKLCEEIANCYYDALANDPWANVIIALQTGALVDGQLYGLLVDHEEKIQSRVGSLLGPLLDRLPEQELSTEELTLCFMSLGEGLIHCARHSRGANNATFVKAARALLLP